MADEDSINKYNIDEKKFIVVMVTKGKPAAPAGASSAPTESAEKKETKEEDKSDSAEIKVFIVWLMIINDTQELVSWPWNNIRVSYLVYF